MVGRKTCLENVLRRIYFNTKHVGSYGGVNALRRVARVLLKEVKRWLLAQDTYTLHKPVRRHFHRRRVVVGGINQQWQVDVVDVSRLKKYNDGVNFLLTVIDVFSKTAWCLPLINTSGTSLVRAFRQLLTDNKSPTTLQTDKEKEFLNKNFQHFLRVRTMGHFTTHNEETKASIVERFNRTLKTRMWKYFTKHQTLRYVDVLQDLLGSYNRSYHRSIGTTPMQLNETNQEDVWQRLYGNESASIVKHKLNVGDHVRISKVKRHFEKGDLPNWSDEIFTVKSVHRTRPPVYRLVDEHGGTIDSKCYEPELQKVLISKDTLYRVQQILQRRKRGKNIQVLMKWWGYPTSFNSLIDERALVKYK